MLETCLSLRATRARGPICLALMFALGACGDRAPLAAPENAPPFGTPAQPVDTATSPPPDTTVAPPAPTPPPDTTAPPAAPPPTEPPPPAGPPEHQGIPFGASIFSQGESSLLLVPPSELDPNFTALKSDAFKRNLMPMLEAARRSNGRVLVSFSGSSSEYTDANGFNLAKWKQKVDEFREFDLDSYVEDGTLMGHFIMDEPNDKNNWNGHQVARTDIDEMARYSKEIWPKLPTIVRSWGWYLKGYNYRYLDAAWAAYHVRFGSIDQFIASNVNDARDLGLSLVMGLNVLAGGGDDGLPGYHFGKNAMTATQLKTWGNALLDRQYACAFFMFRYNAEYFNRPDIREAVAELSQKARRAENKTCWRP